MIVKKKIPLLDVIPQLNQSAPSVRWPAMNYLSGLPAAPRSGAAGFSFYVRSCRSAPRSLRHTLADFPPLPVSSPEPEQASSGLLSPFSGRRFSKNYAFWNLPAQTFKQNVRTTTFLGPGKIKNLRKDGDRK